MTFRTGLASLLRPEDSGTAAEIAAGANTMTRLAVAS
jgi:hypothetical protein